MNVGASVDIAAAFLWLGLVGGISFVEAPLKFCAPNVTLQIGLSIGRVVFRALNALELVLALAITATFVAQRPPAGVIAAFVVAVAALVAQLFGVRPLLNRRSDEVLGGLNPARRSRAHYVYVGFELIKVAALLALGILLLSGGVNELP